MQNPDPFFGALEFTHQDLRVPECQRSLVSGNAPDTLKPLYRETVVKSALTVLACWDEIFSYQKDASDAPSQEQWQVWEDQL